MDSNVTSIYEEKPSGHTKQRLISRVNVRPLNFVHQDFQRNIDTISNMKDFSGPYKDYHPPGDRTPAVGEIIWGDPPYLPSWPGRQETSRVVSTGKPDNLYFRGPFYKGVSETHTEFVNRGVLPGRQFHEFVRHYEEPGLKDEKSITQTDFQPPYPILPRDKAPCLMEDTPKSWYNAVAKEPRNPHAKEHEMRLVQPEVVFVSEEPKRDFSTEHNDNFVCYQKAKTGTKIKDPSPAPKERFLENIREAHSKCPHAPLSEDICDNSCKIQEHCPGSTPRTTTWLMHPKNYTFQNGVMLIPCKCRNDETCDCYKT